MLHEGDWERGCALVERARQLNPNHPGWYWFAAFWDAYRKQDYRGALEVALKINMPGDFYVPAVIAAAYGQLGELDAARTALRQLLAMKPDFAATAREEFEKWFGPGELVEHFLDGLRKAGLEIAGEMGPPPSRPTSLVLPRPTRASRAPRKVSGSRCCHSSTAAATQISRHWQTDFPRTSSPACRASPTSE